MKKIFLFLFFCGSFIQASDHQSEQNNKKLIDRIQKRAHLLKLQTFCLLTWFTAITAMVSAYVYGSPEVVRLAFGVLLPMPFSLLIYQETFTPADVGVLQLLAKTSSQDLQKIAAKQNFNRYLYFLGPDPNCAQKELQRRQLRSLEELLLHGPEYAAIAALTNEPRQNITLAATFLQLLSQEPPLERKQPV